MLTPEQLAKNTKLVRQEKKFFFIVIFLMFYNGKEKAFCRDMCIPTAVFKIWLDECRESVTDYIDEYTAKIKGEKKSSKEDELVPTIDELKNQILVKMQKSISIESDPSKLANTLKILNMYAKEKEVEDKNKQVNIYDELKKGKEE